MSVRVERQGPVSTVILARPEAKNAVDGPTAQALAQACVTRFGRLDYLVPAAAVYEDQRVDGMSAAQWDHTIAVNLSGVFHLVRSAIGRAIAALADMVEVTVRAGEIPFLVGPTGVGMRMLKNVPRCMPTPVSPAAST